MRYPKALTPFCLFIPLCIASLPVFAEQNDESGEKDKKIPKVKIDGFVRSVFEAENFKDGELFHEGRVEFKTKRNKRGMRGELEVDFRTKNDDIQVNEALIDKKFDDGLKLKVGYDLKRFGLEYEESRLERPTIERTYLYRRLDLFNYTGRETVLLLESGDDSANFHHWSLGASFSEAQNSSLIGNWQTDLSDSVRYGMWLQAGNHRIQDGSQLSLALMNSIWHRDSEKLWQIEWVAGLDPNQTEYESVFDDDERVYFTGLNSLYGRYFFREGEESLMILTGLSAVVNDHREFKYNSLGGLLGLRYDIDELRISLNAELIGSNSPIDLKKRTYNESTARFEVLYAF